MDLKHKKIEKEVESLFQVIAKAMLRLKQIRQDECNHPEKIVGAYEERPGRIIENSIICAVCGKLLESPYQSEALMRIT